MSKTFSSNPSRPQQSNRGRGAATTRPPVGRSRQNRESSVGGGSDRNLTASGASGIERKGPSVRGRGQSNPRGKMNLSNQPRLGHGDERPARNSDAAQPSQDQRGQYVGGFTMFAPNEKRRQQINQMAQKETQAYERFKQANSGQTYSYVGTVGGGELTQGQARNRQANAVRAQKFNRQARQAEMREERRQVEEREIETKRMQARQKAEQNSLRESRAAPPEEVRRRRDAFLQQLESSGGSPSRPSQPTEASASFPAQSNPGPVTSKAIISPKKEPKYNAQSQCGNPTAKTRPSQSDSSNCAGNEYVRVKSEFGSPDQSSFRTDGRNELGQNVSIDQEGFDILTGMFPELSPDYLSDLLMQMGSVDAVIELMNGE